MDTGSTASPVTVTGHLDQPGRWLWLVKWLLALPHLILLSFLWIAAFLMTIAAWFSIAITGRYPRSIFDFNLGVMRWTWRVEFYAFTLGTDQYPPFSLGEEPDYPAQLDVGVPGDLSRGLVWVKSWLLALPHLVLVTIFVGGAKWGGGLVSVLCLIAGVTLAVREEYPTSIFDLVMGLHRWAWRVAAYAGLMTDVYPPFRLDQGPDEPPHPGSLGQTTSA